MLRVGPPLGLTRRRAVRGALAGGAKALLEQLHDVRRAAAQVGHLQHSLAELWPLAQARLELVQTCPPEGVHLRVRRVREGVGEGVERQVQARPVAQEAALHELAHQAGCDQQLPVRVVREEAVLVEEAVHDGRECLLRPGAPPLHPFQGRDELLHRDLLRVQLLEVPVRLFLHAGRHTPAHGEVGHPAAHSGLQLLHARLRLLGEGLVLLVRLERLEQGLEHPEDILCLLRRPRRAPRPHQIPQEEEARLDEVGAVGALPTLELGTHPALETQHVLQHVLTVLGCQTRQLDRDRCGDRQQHSLEITPLVEDEDRLREQVGVLGGVPVHQVPREQPCAQTVHALQDGGVERVGLVPQEVRRHEDLEHLLLHARPGGSETRNADHQQVGAFLDGEGEELPHSLGVARVPQPNQCLGEVNAGPHLVMERAQARHTQLARELAVPAVVVEEGVHVHACASREGESRERRGHCMLQKGHLPRGVVPERPVAAHGGHGEGRARALNVHAHQDLKGLLIGQVEVGVVHAPGHQLPVQSGELL